MYGQSLSPTIYLKVRYFLAKLKKQKQKNTFVTYQITIVYVCVYFLPFYFFLIQLPIDILVSLCLTAVFCCCDIYI